MSILVRKCEREVTKMVSQNQNNQIQPHPEHQARVLWGGQFLMCEVPVYWTGAENHSLFQTCHLWGGKDLFGAFGGGAHVGCAAQHHVCVSNGLHLQLRDPGSGLKFRVSGFGFWVLGFQSRVSSTRPNALELPTFPTFVWVRGIQPSTYMAKMVNF